MKILILSLLIAFSSNSGCFKKQKNCCPKHKNIENISGFLTLAENYSKENDMLIIRNADGKVWYKFSFFYDDKNGQYEFYNMNFKPFSFHPDYFNLFIGVTKRKENSFLVNVNHDKNLIKSISLAESNYLKFLSWDELLLKNVYSIAFEKDYIYKEINDSKIQIDKTNVTRVIPEELRGNWMKVRVESKNNLSVNGWINWRNDKCLLVELLYF